MTSEKIQLRKVGGTPVKGVFTTSKREKARSSGEKGKARARTSPERGPILKVRAADSDRRGEGHYFRGGGIRFSRDVAVLKAKKKRKRVDKRL